MLRSIALIAPGLALSTGVANADVNRCSSAPADLAYDGSLFQDMTGDTGWVPSGSAAQVRLTGRLAGETKVAMGLSPTMCWPNNIQLTAPGRAGTGMLDFAYGGELHLFAQIHTSILGESIDWSGEIPVPIVPTDLMLANTQAFDPTLLPGAANDHVQASDTTSPITVLNTDVIGDYIDIVGISGGLHVDVTGAMTTSYRTNSVVIRGASIEQADGQATTSAPRDGFWAAETTPISALGTVTYAPSLVFTIAFDIKILGVRVVNYTLASVTMPLPSVDSDITLSAADANIPLPKAAPLAGAQVDFATGSSQPLAIQNLGEAPLMIEATTPPVGVTAAPLTIAPGQTGNLVITATADAFAAGSAQLVVATNDPGQPSIDITLGTDIGGTSTTDPEGVSGGGCNAGRGGGLAVGLALLALTRRRRVR
jgi:hypothetical protein